MVAYHDSLIQPELDNETDGPRQMRPEVGLQAIEGYSIHNHQSAGSGAEARQATLYPPDGQPPLKHDHFPCKGDNYDISQSTTMFHIGKHATL